MNDTNRYKKSAKVKQKQENDNRHINFVVVVYLLIMIYILALIYLSFTKENIHFVFAENGQIYNEGTFSGLILRNEQVIYANEDGPVKYFVSEGSKVRQNAYVCAVNQDKDTEALIDAQINDHLNRLSDATTISSDDYDILQGKIREYVLNRPSKAMEYVYDAKDIVKGTIMDISQTIYIKDQELFDQVQNQIAANENKRMNNGSYYKIPVGGVVSYSFDGFEEYNIDNFDYSILNKDIEISSVSDDSKVKKGDKLYKIMDNYLFYVVSEINPYCHKYLADKLDNNKQYVTLYFPRKNMEITVKISELKEENDKYYVVFELDRYFDTFFTDRFVQFRIEYENYRGLKVPNSAVTTKNLFIVPASAISENRGADSIQKKVYTDKNATHETIKPIQVKIYYKDSEFAYIDAVSNDQEFQVGDEIYYTPQMKDGLGKRELYKMDTQVSVKGVYVLNKGYTDFKRIEAIYEDENFSIIEPDLGYSVRLFDKIVSDADLVHEFQTFN